MPLVTNRLGPVVFSDKKSLQHNGWSYVQEIEDPSDEYVDSGDGYFYTEVFDISEVERNLWTLYLIGDGDTTYKVQSIFELDEDGVPDVTKAIDRQGDTLVSSPAIASISINEQIPYIRVGIKLADTDSTTMKIILSFLV